MSNKPIIVFEGIEGSGKSYHCKKLYKKISKLGIKPVFTKEPGGSKSTYPIRKIILSGKKNKFNKNSIVLLIEDNSLTHILTLFALSYLNATIVPTGSYYSDNHLIEIYKITKST